MRIIGGEFKGKRYTIPKSFKGRPTTDFAKEGLFNVLSNIIDFEKVSICDLFAGTGAISYEFISRGAERIMAIDKSIVHCNFVNKMFSELKAVKCHCYKKDSFNYISNTENSYDLIFADPPFDAPRLAELPKLIFESDILNEDGIFILEHSRDHNFMDHPNFYQQKKYGHVHFSFFR